MPLLKDDTLTTKLDHALSLAAKGFRVFPLIPNGKTPAVKDWPEKATSDAKQIAKWWNGRFAESNIGVATGRGLVVLDVDVKNGKQGAESYAGLEMLHDIPETLTVTTPTGGKHVYFTTERGFRNSVSRLAKDIDVRGEGGFVVGPGSEVESRFYAAREVGSAVAPIPQSLARGIEGAGVNNVERRVKPDRSSRVELNTPAAQQRASQYLSTAEPAVEGAGGDAHTFAVACVVKDFGISPDVAFELMALLWNDRCSPPWQPEDLQQKIQNAYNHGTKPIGVNDPAMDFEPVQLLGNSEYVGNKRLYLEKYADINVSTDNPYLVDGYIDQAAFSVIYGESHTGKTFVCLDMAFAVAAGTPWNNRRVRQGATVYIAAEGGRGIRKRVAALRKTCVQPNVPFALIPCSVNLLGGSKSDINEIVALVDAFSLDAKTPVSLIVVDTLSRAMAGANENASEDMTAFVGAVDALRVKTNAHVMVVHHSGKDTSKGARGHSSLRAATDTELEVADNMLTVRKQRDGEHVEPLKFRLKIVDLGVDSDERPITSCVVEWSGAGADFVEVPLTPDEMTAHDALLSAIEKGGKAWTTAPDVLAAYTDGGKAEPPTERTVRRWLGALVEKGVARRLSRSNWTAA